LEERRRNGKAAIPHPSDGAFAGTCIHENERQLTQASRDVNKVSVDTGTPQFALVNLGSGIVSDNSNIMSSQPPALAGNQRRGNLAAGQDLSAEHFHFGPQGGELSEPHHGVCGVLSDAQNVESRCAHRVVVQGIGRAEKSKRVEKYAARPIIFGTKKS
jgi:hypothetical protein